MACGTFLWGLRYPCLPSSIPHTVGDRRNGRAFWSIRLADQLEKGWYDMPAMSDGGQALIGSIRKMDDWGWDILQAWHRERVQFLECVGHMAAGSLAVHRQSHNGIGRLPQWYNTPPMANLQLYRVSFSKMVGSIGLPIDDCRWR